ncbi:sensor histidine kinase [Flavobacterium sp. RS13.1]|uniref:sensor histidine kinase n=1 Tax=Flavobacterium sp. RS13.1 TaxID=3400345 RepID=UPI003AAD2074
MFIFYIVVFLNTSLVFSFQTKIFLQQNQGSNVIQIEKTFLNKKQPISNQTINEVKKSQILLLIIVTFFVTGFLFLIYHLKKVRIINQQLESYSKQNEFLISETNHRVNNNLQLISLLIADTLRKKHSEENRNDFIKLLSKVETIASLHRHLYQTKTNNEIDLKEYLLEVKNNFTSLEEDKEFEITFEIDSIQIHSDNAMYIGLLVTELIINSVKHAFEKNHEKRMSLEINKENDVVSFDYKDNGVNSIDKKLSPKLVLQLCLQLKVNPTIETAKGFHLYFNL